MIEISKNLNCYTYEVNVVIHIIATNEPEARKTLDEKGGTMTSRNVKLLDSVLLYNGKKDE